MRRSRHARAPVRAGLVWLIASLALLTGAGAAAAAAWTPQDFNVPGTPYGSLQSVSCTGAGACMAVGSATGGASPAGITEHWDGTSWSMRAVPDPAGKDLTGVSCSSPVACVAVGSLGGVPLAERWDGTRWSATPTGDSGGGSLDAVSCTADGHCLAVGQGRSGGALAEAWDGKSWAPVSPTDAATGFDGVSCTSAESCTAVGAAGRSTVAEHWNGTSWTPEPTVGEPGAASSRLESVSCTSSTDCMAVGRAEFPFTPPDTPRFAPLSEHWDGSTWTLQSTPNPATSGDLIGISCPASGSCTAVGYSEGDVVPLVESWDGTTWTVARAPAQGSAVLLGVSCPSPGTCSAVGAGDVAVGPSGKVIHDEGVALAAQLTGTEWSVKMAQNSFAPSTATVSGVSCSSGSACTAVGSYSSHSGDVALAERWDGTTWSIQPSAPQDGGQIALEAVACPSSRDCIAVGTNEGPLDGSAKDTTVSEQWDGVNWTVRPTAAISEDFQSADLSSVSCASEVACTAVGTIVGGAGNPAPLIERWDGRAWTRQAAPNPSGTSALRSVSCPSATACVAVGSTSLSGGVSAIAETWDGGGWTAQTIAFPAGFTDIFLGKVSCPSGAFCLAVGSAETQSGSSPVALRWDGRSFGALSPPPGGGILESVACVSSTFCLATGQTAGGDHTLAQRWDGSVWTAQSTPDRAGGSESGLDSISCATLYACMAVGEFYPATGARGPLADQYVDMPPPGPPAPPPPVRPHATALLTEPPGAVCRTAFRWVLHRRSGKLRLSGRLSGSVSVIDAAGRVVGVTFAHRRYAFTSPRRAVVRLSGVGRGLVVRGRRPRRFELSSRDGRLRLLVGRPDAHDAVVHGESCWPMRRGELTLAVLRGHGLRVRVLVRALGGAPLSGALLKVTDGHRVQTLRAGRSGAAIVSIGPGANRGVRLLYPGSTGELAAGATLLIRNH